MVPEDEMQGGTGTGTINYRLVNIPDKLDPGDWNLAASESKVETKGGTTGAGLAASLGNKEMHHVGRNPSR